MNNYLKQIYTNLKNPASYGGIDALYKQVKKEGRYNVSREQIANFLHTNDIYSTHKHVRRPKYSRHIYVKGPLQYLGMDTINMSEYYTSKPKKRGKKGKKFVSQGYYNDGYRYILLVQDLFNRYIWSRPLKTLKAEETKIALKEIMDSIPPDKVRYIVSDKGTEFLGSVPGELKKRNITKFTTNNDKKMSTVERTIRVVKDKLARHMEANNTHEWLQGLKKVTTAYNDRYHRSIGRAPNQVNDENSAEVYKYMQDKRLERMSHQTKYAYPINAMVRLDLKKTAFRRHYDNQRTSEQFVVADRLRKEGINLYSLKDEKGEIIKGLFQEFELSRSKKPRKDKYFRVQEIIGEEGEGEDKMLHVRWIG